MISSRRLAREWALKILYQSDVGKMSIAESQVAALERLRLDFVKKASRAATDSLLEERLTDTVTAHLFDVLTRFDADIEMALRECLARTFESGDFWTNLGGDFTFSRQSFNALWELPRRTHPVVLPAEHGVVPGAAAANGSLTESDRARLTDFHAWAREALPEAAMRSFAQEVRLGRPEGAKLKETHEYVVRQWQQFPANMSERWAAAGQVVEKQAFDWMRVAAFALKLVTGVWENRDELDRTLQRREIGWALNRQVSVDRNILRMAAFELAHLRGIPTSVTINEAVELAKKYSTAESSKFVNGVLGAIVAQSPGGEPLEWVEGAATAIADVPVDAEVDVDEPLGEEELAQV